MTLRLKAPSWGLMTAFAATLVCGLCIQAIPAAAQPKKKPAADKSKPVPVETKDDKATGDKKKTDKPKNFDFTGLDLNGRMRTPQLLYFLERANEELERASLEKRTFIPHMVRSVEEEAL